MIDHSLTLALDVPGPWDLIAIILGLFFGGFAGAAIHAAITGRNVTSAKLEAEQILREGKETAETRAREIKEAA